MASRLNQMKRPGESNQESVVSKTRLEPGKVSALTKREREIIALIGEGLNNKEIAERLFISQATVRTHLTSIFAKLGVPDRLKLIVFAYRHGLADLPD